MVRIWTEIELYYKINRIIVFNGLVTIDSQKNLSHVRGAVMKMKIITLITLFVFTFTMFSCIVTSQNIVKEYSCDDFSENPTGLADDYDIEIGDKITIKLCSNMTTGFQWDYQLTDDTVVKEEDHDFEEPDEDLVGAAGTEVWTFEGTKKGTTEISMGYSQPWEGGIKEEWTYRVTITVN